MKPLLLSAVGRVSARHAFYCAVVGLLLLARGLAEKLLIYATGHGLEFTDEVVLTDLVRKARAQKYGLRALIHEVVASPTFQSK